VTGGTRKRQVKTSTEPAAVDPKTFDVPMTPRIVTAGLQERAEARW
jgi:hypothetical protein